METNIYSKFEKEYHKAAKELFEILAHYLVWDHLAFREFYANLAKEKRYWKKHKDKFNKKYKLWMNVEKCGD